MKKIMFGLLAVVFCNERIEAYTVKISNPTKHTAFVSVNYACVGCRNDVNVEVPPYTADKVVGTFSLPLKVSHIGGRIKPNFTDLEIANSEIANSISPKTSPVLSNEEIEIEPIHPNLFMKSGQYKIIEGIKTINPNTQQRVANGSTCTPVACEVKKNFGFEGY